MCIFSNREISILIWIVLGIGYCIWQSAIRQSLGGVIRALLQRTILALFALFSIYITLTVWLLYKFGVWDFGQLKATIFWAVTAGAVTINRTITNRDSRNLFRKWITDNLKIIVVLEFVVNVHSAPLLIEFLLVPMFSLLGAMLFYAKRNEKYRTVERFLNGLLVLIGLMLIVYALYRVGSAFGDFATLRTLQDFYTPPLLSLLLLPFLFGLLVYVAYEEAFLRLRTTIPNPSLRTYAKRHAVLAFRCDLESLRRWARNTAGSRPQDREDVNSGIQEVIAARIRERNPHRVSAQDGWSPYEAIRFLNDQGLVTDDYHRTFEENWGASTPYLELGNGPMCDNIAYYVEGDAHAAKRLKIVLNVNNPDDPSASELAFASIARSLLAQALGEGSGTVADTVLAGNQSRASAPLGRTVELWKDDWEGGIRGGYTRTLTISHDTGPDCL